MSDLISRQAAIDEIREWKSRLPIEGLVEHIKQLPSAQPAPQWIPNTPENVPKDPFRKQIQLANGWIITGWFDGEDWYSVPGYDEPLKFEDVVAWCELPEPYQPGSEEEEKDSES